MIKVIIIDDEPLVRVGLKSMIHWEEQGYEIIGEALNGQQGLDLIIKHQPDLVITDIKMPMMDGLEMMRLASEAKPQTKFIILSSYDEFQLVKQAMKQGAEEYLIKLDLEPEILLNTLAGVREKILTERDKSGDEDRFEKGLRKNPKLLRESFFKRIISKPVKTQTELVEQANSLGIELDERLACAVVRIDNIAILEKYDSNEIHSFEVSVLNIINEIVNDIFKGYTFAWKQREFVIVFSGGDELNAEGYRNKIADMGERLTQMLKQYFNLSISIGIGNPYRSYPELAESYMEGRRAAEQSYYRGLQGVLFWGEMSPSSEVQEAIDITELKNIFPKAIEFHDLEMIGIVFERLISILNDPKLSREQAYDLCFQIAYLINGITDLSDAQLKAIIGYHHLSLYESILTLDTQAGIIYWLTGLERRLCQFIIQTDEQKNHRLITKAKKYILEHYMKEISLNKVAAVTGISPGYLSTIFRQYTGICFTDYVTEIKIEQAKKLLQESEYKIYEIAGMLGYQNAYYFSKVFKKITGMTPSEFSRK